jgi:hypothetical protein
MHKTFSVGEPEILKKWGVRMWIEFNWFRTDKVQRLVLVNIEMNLWILWKLK